MRVRSIPRSHSQHPSSQCSCAAEPGLCGTWRGGHQLVLFLFQISYGFLSSGAELAWARVGIRVPVRPWCVDSGYIRCGSSEERRRTCLLSCPHLLGNGRRCLPLGSPCLRRFSASGRTGTWSLWWLIREALAPGSWDSNSLDFRAVASASVMDGVYDPWEDSIRL